MTPRKRVAVADGDPVQALIRGIAMDIGKEVVGYVERQYPQAVSATSSTFRLALRNTVYNEIIAALRLDLTNEASVLAYLAERRAARRKLKAMWSRIRDTDWEAARAKVEAAPDQFQAVRDAADAVIHPVLHEEDED